jgi:DNA-binding NarL/FixJ family response regulator
LLERGETDQAEEELKQTGFLERIPPEGTEGIRLSWNHALARGRLRLAKGQIREAIDDLLDAIERREAQSSIGAEFTNLRSTAALALAIAGEHEPAAELLAKELADNQHFGTRRAIAITLRAKAQLEHHQRAIELLRESASLLENSPSRLEHARTLIELGAALRRSNRRAEARSPLREGLRLAQQCDANPLAQRALEELEATGERVPRDRRWGPEALTPSERRVAGMAAEGLTNPQIAQALFVTLKTVERHLSNAYLKLNINSRTQLPAALHVRSDTLGSKG